MLAELDESGLPMDKLGLFLRVLKHIYDENFLEIYEDLVSPAGPGPHGG